MEAFSTAKNGWKAFLTSGDREILARLITDAAELLHFAAQAEIEAPDGRDYPRMAVPTQKESAILAALDFTVDATAALEDLAHSPQAGTGFHYRDPALNRLLPPMSRTDAKLAVDLRDLIEEDVIKSKLEYMRLVREELDQPSGPAGAVFIRRGQEIAWLTVINDLRLALSGRLGIDTMEDAKVVHKLAEASQIRARAQGRCVKEEEKKTADEELREALAVLYEALAWWQESLLEILGEKGSAR